MNWRDDANCGGRDVDLFFPDGRNSRAGVLVAKSICKGCPVINECLEDALRIEGRRVQRWGIRGGLTPEERAKVAKRRQRRRARK